MLPWESWKTDADGPSVSIKKSFRVNDYVLSDFLRWAEINNEDHNLRIDVDIVQVARDAATLKVYRWSDTTIHDSKLRWMACPYE